MSSPDKSSPDTTVLVDFLKKAKIGTSFPVGQLLPGVTDTQVRATLVDSNLKKFWEFDLSYYGVNIARTYIELLPSGKLTMGEKLTRGAMK